MSAMFSDMLFRVATVLTLICIFTTKVHCATIVQSIYKRIDVSDISSSTTSVITNVRSLSQCAALCLGDRGCGGVEFETQSQSCTLRGWPRIIYSENVEIPRKVWVNGNVIVFFATRADGSDLTYSQAEELCSNLGARVPTPQEMYDALDAGLNECRCGWTQGGIIRLVIQQSDPECPYTCGWTQGGIIRLVIQHADPECPNTNGQYGVLSCKWTNTAADTFCTF